MQLLELVMHGNATLPEWMYDYDGQRNCLSKKCCSGSFRFLLTILSTLPEPIQSRIKLSEVTRCWGHKTRAGRKQTVSGYLWRVFTTASMTTELSSNQQRCADDPINCPFCLIRPLLDCLTYFSSSDCPFYLWITILASSFQRICYEL